MTSLFMLITAISMNTLAHQQKAAITKILFNPRTGNIEIMHRFYMHDAEHAVKEIFGSDADIIASEETKSQFSQYVFERFAITDKENHVIPLKPVGYESDGKFFWVYQETAQPAETSELNVSHQALRDLWPSQINTVNFEGKGKVKTLTFDGNVELLKVEFESGH